jgi:hypothetical protein
VNIPDEIVGIAIEKMSILINSGKPEEAREFGYRFMGTFGVERTLNAHFWFQMRLAALLVNEDQEAWKALVQMRMDEVNFTPEMERDCDRDHVLHLVRRGGRLTRERMIELTELCVILNILNGLETQSNRIAVTEYALGRVYAALHEFATARFFLQNAEDRWMDLELSGHGDEIDQQWRRNNRFRLLLALARQSATDPLHYTASDQVALAIITDEGEINMRRKQIARLIKLTPFAYWLIAWKVGP